MANGSGSELVTRNDIPPCNPYPVLACGVLAVSGASVLIKMSDAPPLAIAAYRMGFTFLLMLPALLWSGEYRRIGRADVLRSLASGFCLALHFATWITSLQYTSVASSTVLVTTQPLFVVLGSYVFFRERFPARALIGLALAFTGSACIGLSDFRVGGPALRGDALALAGALAFAAYLLLGRSLRQRLPLLPYTTLVYGMCTAVLLLFAGLSRVPLYPYAPRNLLLFFALAFLSTAVGHTIFNWAVKFVPAPVVAVSILGEPVGATALAYLLLREVPAVLTLAGGAVIVFGVAMFIYSAQASSAAQ